MKNFLRRLILFCYRLVRGFPVREFVAGDPLDYAHANGLSLVRWGDGESNILHGIPIHFQRYDVRLADGLRKIICNPHNKILIGIPKTALTTNIFCHLRNRIWLRTRFVWAWHSYRHQKFTDALALREHPARAINVLNKIISRKAWCILVCSNFDDARLLDTAPAELCYVEISKIDCFDKYSETLTKIKSMLKALSEKHESRNGLILISAGPAAKLWVYDLADHTQAYDIGHLFKAAVSPPKVPQWRA